MFKKIENWLVSQTTDVVNVTYSSKSVELGLDTSNQLLRSTKADLLRGSYKYQEMPLDLCRLGKGTYDFTMCDIHHRVILLSRSSTQKRR